MRKQSTRRGEAGSAYIVTLLALVVLTIMALSLVLVTQTEIQSGTAEKTINRVFYSADTGLGIAAASALTSSSYSSRALLLNQTANPLNPKLLTADRVTVSPMVPIATVRCDWCPANDDGVPKFWKVNHYVTSTAQRISWDKDVWDGTGNPPASVRSLGQKTLSVMFEFQPWATPPVESLPDAAALAQMSF
jgi:Tfp pilus assembly protein PilX